MNTLSKAITAQFFATPDQYHALRAAWAAYTKDPEHTETATHHLLYLALLGKDWRKAFTPITNPTKRANGNFDAWPLFHAMSLFRSTRLRNSQPTPPHLRAYQETREAAMLAPFGGLVSSAALYAVLACLPDIKRETYPMASYQPHVWPFDAYVASVRELACAG